VVHAALNIPVGEKWAYAMILVLVLLRQGVWVHTAWYDINCRWGPAFRMWAAYAALLGDIPSWLASCIAAMRCPLPPFHKYMHNTACQRANAASATPGVALGSGEPAEQTWSHLAPLGKITQYMSHHHRNQTLNNHVQDFCVQKDVQLGPFLGGRMNNAVREWANAKSIAREREVFLEYLVRHPCLESWVCMATDILPLKHLAVLAGIGACL
jgi:hypothetical protein